MNFFGLEKSSRTFLDFELAIPAEEDALRRQTQKVVEKGPALRQLFLKFGGDMEKFHVMKGLMQLRYVVLTPVTGSREVQDSCNKRSLVVFYNESTIILQYFQNVFGSNYFTIILQSLILQSPCLHAMSCLYYSE